MRKAAPRTTVITGHKWNKESLLRALRREHLADLDPFTSELLVDCYLAHTDWKPENHPSAHPEVVKQPAFELPEDGSAGVLQEQPAVCEAGSSKVRSE